MSPTVLPLAGVIIGACGTLLGQHLAMRVDVRHEADRRASDQRAERKDAIIGFLSATERVEQHRGQLAVGPDHDPGVAYNSSERIYVSQMFQVRRGDVSRIPCCVPARLNLQPSHCVGLNRPPDPLVGGLTRLHSPVEDSGW